MTWYCAHSTYSPEQGGGYCRICFSDIDPSGRSRSTNIVETCCSNDNKTESCHTSPSGMTCARSMDIHGEVESILSQEDSPARTFHLPEHDREFLDHAADYGQSSLVSLARYDHATHSLRTPQRLLFEDSTSSCVILPRWGMMCDGVVSGLMTSVHRTSGKDSGYWPTPRAREPGRTSQGYGRGLMELIEGKAQIAQTTSRVTHSTLHLWETPTSRDWKSGKASQYTMGRNSRPLSEQVGGALNPMWVEWLMGWPIGWTDYEPLAMDKFLQWQQQHGVC